jgi:glycosyltransferase involved in cell wall biosynthesis
VDRTPEIADGASSTVPTVPTRSPLFARFLTGAARRAWTSWRGGRLDLSPSTWLVHLRNYYRELAPAPPPPPRLLVVTDVVPTFDQDSGSFRLFHLLKALREIGYDVTLIADEQSTPLHYLDALTQIHVLTHLGREQVLEHLHAEGNSYRHVILCRPDVAFRYFLAVRAWAPRAHVTYDTVDMHWVRLQRGADLTGNAAMREDADRYRRIERFNVESADAVLAVSADDEAAIVADTPAARVHLVPNIHPAKPAPAGLGTREGLVFIGSFWHAPNEDAVLYFAHDVLPLIQRELPQVTFTILGSHITDRIKALASSSIRPLGFVSNADAEFDRSRVFVAPLRYGAGVKGKIGHSMSCGLPVVTTTVGAEGLDIVDGEHALIADQPDAFARAVIRAYSDARLWKRLSTRGRAHIASRFSERATRDRLRQIFPLESSRRSVA